MYAQAIKHETNVGPQMKKAFKKQITAGDCSKWETSLLMFALLNSSHGLLPEAHPARKLLDDIRSFRNILVHSASCSMETTTVDRAVASMQLVADHVGVEQARAFAARMAAIRDL